MARRRPTYSAEFKAEALRRVRNSDASLMSIAKELGMASTTLKAWLEAARPKPDIPLTDDERSELKRLRKQVRELEMEREILKKATAFFAKYSE
jgi:transposase